MWHLFVFTEGFAAQMGDGGTAQRKGRTKLKRLESSDENFQHHRDQDGIAESTGDKVGVRQRHRG